MGEAFNIVVIDDDHLVCETIVSLLEIAGHKVRSAHDGDEGLALIKQTTPELVITDIVMPTKEGMETIIDILKHSADVKIIAISGQGQTTGGSYLDMAKKLGAQATLAKPFSHQELIETVEKVMH